MRGLVAILLLYATLAEAAPLGRLFFTPAERARIDSGLTAHPDDTTVQTPPVVSGVVRRSDGSATVWIDGQAQHGKLKQLGEIIPGISQRELAAPGTAPESAPDDQPRMSIRIHRQ